MHVGICGAGIGGLMTAICLAHHGAEVTVLEAADQLGEIGAGIQMTPNVARLLRRYGVDKAIGDNLVRFEELNLRRWDGTKVGYAPLDRVERTLDQPWWLVHRHHLHTGLVDVARRVGCKILTASRVCSIDHETDGTDQVVVRTDAGGEYVFDLFVGADGLGSVVRRNLFPDVTPRPPNGNCAFRAIVPMDELRKHDDLRELVEKSQMDVWMGPNAYIITYPISGGKDFNMVLSHFVDPPITATQDADTSEAKQRYRAWDPRIRKIIDMIPSIKRWPLLVTGPLDSWSSPKKNVVLMGDAAHSMQNHMAQGAATSMEDGAFLARCLREVMHGSLSMAEAIDVFEQGRIPKSHVKQQISFLNGFMWMLEDGPAQQARDEALAPELKGQQPIRSPNAYSDPGMIIELYGYDAEAHAEEELRKYQNRNVQPIDQRTGLTSERADLYVNWFLPKGHQVEIKSKL